MSILGESGGMSASADGGGLSRARLGRMREILAEGVESGDVPGLVALVHRRGETHVEALGTQSLDEDAPPMRPDTIFRISSMIKPITAVAAMTLVEECRLRLDDPVDDLLPELADRRVLRRADGPLDDTVPAERAITLRDLLTFRLGYGATFGLPEGCPIQRATAEAGLEIGPDGPQVGADEWLKRLGALPLVHQPGTAWMYHTGADVLGVLIARAAGQPLADVLRERVFDPLGMRDTGFHVPAGKLGRMAVPYGTDPVTGGMARSREARAGAWDRPPVFASGGGGPSLLSTAGDYLAFSRMLLDKGRYDGGRLLSRPAVELMTTDHLTPGQKAGNEMFLGSGGWGFGLAVDARRDDLAFRPGRFGWTGGLGTEAYADPHEDLVGVLLTQRVFDSPVAPRVFQNFWTAAYAAIDD
ncbi:serine hydrolase domain-containing protein [Nonomuraea jiangxiensis]|uniref:CubicO group peptidase, beta-lactamase class C family n=1 Tax=Nonomuraea jiangxiensis TaxID=633440 RepID=A0A1G8C848_9ACTN|nr:serine hydrolase domain-containing protein [Nonomuraea jiangxiensis]SDH41552.1 CubicO group peptidase, beta-lactamase class C family [Nonomuraea jiangxiensis]